MRLLRTFSLVLLAVALTGYPEIAAASGGKLRGNDSDAVLTLDPSTTQIHYTVQGWPHVTHGTFRLDRGVIEINSATGKAAGKIVVSAASGDSGSAMRDREMKSQSHPFTMNVSVQPDADNFFTATTRFAIPYVAWGLKNPSILIFRCDVTVYVDVSAHGRVTWDSGVAAHSPRASAQ